ncbi:DUF7169 domain-containing protein [Arthrobacter sp. B2a2-09]|uniref:DUF7169 domain-containing protein n=1 Tax=Arthrobacter sp. B2a2-09 TaxID=2952822 RepID=UPI0022CD9583|nr:hypothetical protein [Arthrobacter sp. B2a2-09]MCZ9884616.1 hypothetical protein [Arthrobacter sp. B2a2-09]
MTTSLPSAVRVFAVASLSLARSLADAEEIQWTAAPVPKPREDTTERAKGGHGDPTLATVLDERRLAVRQAVEEAHATLAANTEATAAARQKLDLAIASWNGDDV